MKFDQITKKQLEAFDLWGKTPEATMETAKAYRDQFFNEQPELYKFLVTQIMMALYAECPPIGVALGVAAMVYQLLGQQSSSNALEGMLAEVADAPQD